MAEKYIPRLQKLYKDEIVSSLMKELNLSNVMQVPKLDKINLHGICLFQSHQTYSHS